MLHLVATAICSPYAIILVSNVKPYGQTFKNLWQANFGASCTLYTGYPNIPCNHQGLEFTSAWNTLPIANQTWKMVKNSFIYSKVEQEWRLALVLVHNTRRIVALHSEKDLKHQIVNAIQIRPYYMYCFYKVFAIKIIS